VTVQRMDNVLIVVDDLEAAKAFFVELGMELEGEMPLEGRWVDRVVGLENVRCEIATLRTPDGHCRIAVRRTSSSRLPRHSGRRHSLMGAAFRWFILCGLLALCPTVAEGQKPEGAQSSDIPRLVGDWFGESICVDKAKSPACNDEHVVYHVAALPGKTDIVNIAADRIVNGKPVAMGAFDFLYAARSQTLTSEFKNDRVHIIFEFAVKGDLIEGTLSTLPERTVVRRIKLKKEKS
jgi:hypothetical protein